MKRLILWSVLLAVTVTVTACSTTQAGKQEIKLAPVSALPPNIQTAPSTVRQAYQFAVANPDLLKQIPCYCGCGAVGHTSNLGCYVKEYKADSSLVFDDHAFG